MNSLIMDTIPLSLCYKKVFTLLNKRIIGKNSMKHYFKRIFLSHLHEGYITYTDYPHAKKVCKHFEIKKIRRIS